MHIEQLRVIFAVVDRRDSASLPETNNKYFFYLLDCDRIDRSIELTTFYLKN